MRVPDTPNEHATDDERIRDLMLINLFAVFNERDPERRLEAIAANYAEDVTWTDGVDLLLRGPRMITRIWRLTAPPSDAYPRGDRF